MKEMYLKPPTIESKLQDRKIRDVGQRWAVEGAARKQGGLTP
jgi:hypothetical protein